MKEAMAKSSDELMKGIENQHPSMYYLLASKLFEERREPEAVFWFYAGQLRYRFHLAAHPELDPTGDKALFASLSESIGVPINQWGMGDLTAFEKTLGAVATWDEQTPNGFTSKTQYAEQWKATREGMAGFVKYVHENADAIRAQRKANGLPNMQ